MPTVTHIPLYHLVRRVSAPARPTTLHLNPRGLLEEVASGQKTHIDVVPLHRQPRSKVHVVETVSSDGKETLSIPTLQFRPDLAAEFHAAAKEKSFKEKQKAHAKTLKFRVLQSMRRKQRAFVSTCGTAPKVREVTPRVVLHGALELRDF